LFDTCWTRSDSLESAMRYDERDRESTNVDDRRGQRGPGGGFGIPLPIGGGGMSFTTMLIIGALMLLFGMNPLDLLRGATPGGIEIPLPGGERPIPRSASQNPFEIPGRNPQAPTQKGADEMGTFIKRVLADTEDVWNRKFQAFGKQYKEPQLVLFTGSTRTACGLGQAAMGPFYCPLDRKVYIDLAFYEQMKRQFNSPGDFAQAYVIAHEVGHHVQTLLGIAGRVQEMKQSMSERDANKLQVRMELQADCLAGVWAAVNDKMKQRLEPGDIEEALNAASQIGDDMIQRRQTGRIVPDAFTHGTAAQRVRWFKTGLQSGDMRTCDTFNAQDLG
jgi:predicted metalloprotease